jgi:hypothetical protein
MSDDTFGVDNAVNGDLETLERSRYRLQQLLELTLRHRPGAVEPALAAALGLYTTAIEVRTTWSADLADTWGRLVIGGMDHRVAMQVAKDIHRPEES